MSNSKCTLTTRHLLCYVFIFASFILAFSNGFMMTRFPPVKTDAEIGKSVELRWNFTFDLLAKEKHYFSKLEFQNEVKFFKFADRQDTKTGFRKRSAELFNFTISGTTDILLNITDVQATFDGTVCLTVEYDVGDPPEIKTTANCTVLFTFAYPLIDVSPKKVIFKVGDQMSLYCNATGKPPPNITWIKSDEPSTILSSSSWFNLSATGPSVQGFYMCIANNSYGTHNKTLFVEVQYKPEIQYIPNDQLREEGTTVLLYCNASGNPIPNVTWSKKNTVEDILVGQGSASLVLTNINSTNTEDYLCTAKNLLGKTSNMTSLTVGYRPINIVLTVSLKPEEVIAGRELILNCTSSALPEANQFEFFHNNASVKNGTDGFHTISNITASDSGEYKCVPSNVLGKGAPANVKINVLVPPKLNESLENRNITINETDTLLLRCSATGNPTPVITWTKDPNIKLLQSNGIYKKENTSRDDAGVYKCTANNSIGEAAYSEATVIVNYPSEITNITSNQTINETNTVYLHCNAQGHPNPLVQWFKGDLSIGNASTGNASVTIKNVKWKDGGKYVCRASNLLATKSAATEVNVQYKPINTTLVTDTGKYVLAIHETLMLRCSAQANPPAHRFRFYIKNSSTLQESSDSTYTIRKNAWSPAEEYNCLPRNMLGDGTSADVNISFLEQPSFQKLIPENKSLTVNETEKMELHCLVRGTPQPNVTWTKDGTSETISNNEVFTKNNTNRSDAGIYRCRASNGVGRVLETEFSVVVNYKPIYTRLVSVSGRYGITINESLTLNCSTESIPRPHSYSFQVNGTTINRASSSNSTLTITKAQSFYDENYTCFATNLIGSGEKSNVITITMYERPFISSKPVENVTVDENKRLTLECIASGKPRPQITWTRGNSMVIIKTGETYSKASAEKCDAGVYRCTADNGVMEPVTAQATVTVKSFPEAPEILNIAISIPRIEVHWEQPPINCSLSITGYLAQVRKKGSQEEWTECEASHNTKTDEWSCSFEELEGGTTYTLQIFAINRFGRGQPAVKDFETKELGGAYSSDASKGGLSRNDYILIGACVGGLILLVFIIFMIKKLKTQHGESNLQTPIELREQEEGQIIQNGCNGPMTASQVTLEVKETVEEKENTLEVNVNEEKGNNLEEVNVEEENGEKESDEDKKM